jgi:hypothetical protein
MQPTGTIPSRPSREAPEAITIRMAVAADATALSRLAQLDSAPRPRPVPTLVAEADGELRAALSLDGSPAIADPFHPSAELVAMLVERARQLQPLVTRRRSRRWPFPRVARPAQVARA